MLLCCCVCACSISVTAERWVPIEEVKEAALLAWLATKQAQGWVWQRSSSRKKHHGCVLWHQYGPSQHSRVF
jgi:hypothetical protein